MFSLFKRTFARIHKSKPLTLIGFFLLIILFCVGCSEPPVRSKKLSESGLISSKVSPTGSIATVTSINNEIAIWDLQLQKRLHTLVGDTHGALNMFAAFNDNGGLLLTAKQKEIVLWDVSTGKELVSYNLDSPIQAISLSADGEKALIALLNAKALLVDLNEGGLLTSISHAETINSVALSFDGKYALTGSDDKFAVLWDLRTAKVIHKFKHNNSVSHVAFSPDGKTILTASAFDSVKLWSLKTGKLRYQLDDKPINISCVQFSKDGRLLALGILSGSINVWQLDDDRAVIKKQFYLAKPDLWRPSATIISSLAFDPKKNYLISVDSRGFVSWWPLSFRL